MEPIMNSKRERLKLTPEQLFDIYLECNAPGVPVKPILERYGLRPWDLVAIRKKIKAAALETLARPGKQGRKQQVIAAEQYQKVSKELDETEIKRTVVTIIKEAIDKVLYQKCACGIFGLSPRKLRRWANPKPVKPRAAWNKILERERDAIEAAAWTPELIGKPVSHIFVHGHNTGKFFTSLLDGGFSLLCYDGTQFKADTGIIVWAIPVMILPQRYLLHIGHSINGITSGGLTRSVKEAYCLFPEHLTEKVIAHSDRGSAVIQSG